MKVYVSPEWVVTKDVFNPIDFHWETLAVGDEIKTATLWLKDEEEDSRILLIGSNWVYLKSPVGVWFRTTTAVFNSTFIAVGGKHDDLNKRTQSSVKFITAARKHIPWEPLMTANFAESFEVQASSAEQFLFTVKTLQVTPPVPKYAWKLHNNKVTRYNQSGETA